MVGKWHLCPTVEMNLASTRRNWPTGRGFERWYGFLGAETSQWYPELTYDNHPVDQPRTPEEGYHFGEDITDKAIEFIMDAKAVAPGQAVLPVLRARRLPRPAPRPQGVDREVRRPLRRGLRGDARDHPGPADRDGHRPADTELPPMNPLGTPETRTGPDGQPFSAVDTTRPWDSLSDEETAALRADGGGLRRVPVPRRRPDRAAARLPRGDRPAGEHHGHRRLGQRGQRRGRPGRVGQRDAVHERHPGRHRPPTWPCSTSSAARRPTTTTPTGGRWPSTLRSRCGSATSSTAAPPTRA